MEVKKDPPESDERRGQSMAALINQVYLLQQRDTKLTKRRKATKLRAKEIVSNVSVCWEGTTST